jgi:hypothetical protein
MVIGPHTLLQRWDWPSISANVIRNSAAVDSSTPGMSSLCLRLSWRLGIRIAAMTSVTMPTGRLTKKIQRQL